MKTTINLHVEIECKDESVDKGLVADFICASINKKFKKVKGVVVYDADLLPFWDELAKKEKK
jgi:hypothetical protein